jgi:hypothetical protein
MKLPRDKGKGIEYLRHQERSLLFTLNLFTSSERTQTFSLEFFVHAADSRNP